MKKVPKNPVILCVIHHRQNRLESTCKNPVMKEIQYSIFSSEFTLGKVYSHKGRSERDNGSAIFSKRPATLARLFRRFP
jgi:hypothetical protein